MFHISDTVNVNSAETAKEPVPGPSVEAKQDDTGGGTGRLVFIMEINCYSFE